jgi:hypothetical protein
VFFIDPSTNGGNISGDPMVHLEFDTRLDWRSMLTFYGRYLNSDTGANPAVPARYQFIGDGREPSATATASASSPTPPPSSSPGL